MRPNNKIINTNIDNVIISKVTKFCRTHKEALTNKEKDCLTIFKKKLAIFTYYQKFISPRK